MNNIINLITSNLLTLFIVGFFLIIIIGAIRKRKQQTNGQAGTSADYSGNTGGVSWTLRSVVRKVASQRGRTSWHRSASWRTDGVRMPAGKFIMIMSTPEDMNNSNRQIKRGGFLNDLINKAADFALDFYVSGYFGDSYRSLINIGTEGVKIERPELKDFFILTNNEPLASKYFDANTAATISTWKSTNHGFAGEGKVDQFGLLFSPDGVILTCQTNMTNPQEVKMFSDFGAVLAVRMQSVIS